jgi:hypothetical protein
LPCSSLIISLCCAAIPASADVVTALTCSIAGLL